MIEISIKVNGSTATATASGSITSGMVGLPVYIQYDESWNDLTKTAYFRVGKLVRKRESIGTATTVPWELLRNHGIPLQIGVEGKAKSGDIVIPTIWATVDTIFEGASGAIPAAPNPDSGGGATGGGAVIDDSVTTPDKTWSSQKIADEIEGLARIDDPAVGADAWSSKNIVDRLCPAFSESGAVATCQPVAGYPLEVVSHIRPVQAGSGDPSPDNIRPITGHTAVKLTRCGKNLWDEQVRNGHYSDKTGEPTNAAAISSANPVRVSPGMILYNCGVCLLYAYFYDATGNWIGPQVGFDIGIPITVPENAAILHFNIASSYGRTYNYDICISLSETEYEPYRGDEFTLDLGQTVYGGSLNWRTGVLTVDMTTYQITSVDNVSYDGGYARIPLTTSVPPERRAEAVCSHLRYEQSVSADSVFWIDGAGTALRIRIAEFTTKEEYKNWIQENNPVFVIPTDPITVQLTPQEILALSGVNTLYSDTGDTDVAGRADPVSVIDDLKARIAALETAVVSNT